MRRYEILLPLRFNDGTAVPDEVVGEVIVSVRDRFAAASFETQTIRGVWQHEGQACKDDSVRLFADVPDTQVTGSGFSSSKSD